MKFLRYQHAHSRTNTHKKIYVIALALSALFSCFNGSVATINSLEPIGPDINFHGTLEDHNHTAKVQAILIGGKYESIPVYQAMHGMHYAKNNPASQAIDPKQNKILINLQDIKSIALEHPNNPTASSREINNKPYIAIIIESLHGTKKKYLVEATRKITCKEIDTNANAQEQPTLQTRDVSFMHVRKLTIERFTSNHPYKASQISPISKEPQLPTTAQEKKDFKNNAAELLHAIEENVKNMPLDNPSAFEAMRSTVLTLLKSLRDQLQKFLDMIK